MLPKIIEFCLRQKIIVVILALVLLAYGVFSFIKIPIDAYPDVSQTQVQVILKMPGASPVEIETRVINPLELELIGLQGQTSIRSLSKYATALITINFEDSISIQMARQMVSEKLSNVMPELPDGVTGGLAPIVTPLSDMYMFSIEGNMSLMDKRELLDYTIRPALRSIKGVADVSAYGGFVKSFVVVPDFRDMALLGISIVDLEKALKNNLRNYGAGVVNRYGENYLVKVESASKNISDIEDISIPIIDHKDNTTKFVRIKDFASVVTGYRTRLGFVTKDGKDEAVEGIVLGLKGSNSKSTIEKVEQKLEELKSSLPKGISINTFYNRSDLTQKAVDNVIKALIEAIVLIVIVLFLFLGDFRASVAVSIILPLALSVAFILMQQYGITANLMSLGGLIIAVGILVDSAVVIVENAFERLGHDKKSTKLHVIYRSCKEIAPSVVSGIIVIVVFFVPIITLQGLEGKMFIPLGLTVVFSLLGSLVLSITVIPVMSALVLKAKPHKDTFLIKIINKVYNPSLNFCLKYPKSVIVAALIFLALSLSLFNSIGKAFMPSLDEGDIVLSTETLPSISLDQSKSILLAVEKRIMDEVPEVKTIVARSGSDELGLDPSGLNQTDMFIILKNKKEWQAKTKQEVIDKIQNSINDFKGISFIFTQPIDMRISEMVTGTRGDLAIKIFGSDIKKLNELSSQIADILKSIHGNSDVYTALNKGVNYLYINPKKEAMARSDVDIEEFSKFMQSSLDGIFIDFIPQGFIRTPVMIRQEEGISHNISKLKSLELTSNSDMTVPISSIADIQEIDGPIVINREQGKRLNIVRSNIVDRDLDGFVKEAMQRIEQEVSLPLGYSITYGGQFENQQRANARFATVIPLSIVIIFFILFFTFRSIILSLLILLNIPFAITGGLISLFLSGEYISVPASVGFITLFGIAVLNGLVMVGYFVQLIKQGFSIDEAVVMGAKRRLRPVLMTAFIAALGLVPMLLSSGVGSEVQKPLAIVVLGGLFTSSILTLLILPPTFRFIAKKINVV